MPQVSEFHDYMGDFPAEKVTLSKGSLLEVDTEIYEELVDKVYEFADQLMIFLVEKGIKKEALSAYLAPAMREFKTVMEDSIEYFDNYQ